MKSLRYSSFLMRCLSVASLVALVSLLIPISGASASATSSQSAALSSHLASTATDQQPSPSIVTVSGSGLDFVLTVDGVSQTIRGVGYNPIYRHLSPDARAERYDRDFGLMQRSGINTISGWDQDKGYVQDKFDELLLTKAQEYGIGVIMPFYLSPNADYTNEEFKQRISEEVRNWVLQFRNYPAVRMWGLGNEVLYVMPPGQYTDEQQAFAEFLVQLADMVHELDPNHPVIYRESEDVYIPILRDALTADEVERIWFVYGMNVYTFRINEILSDWQDQGLDMPILVSEFAPEGLTGEDRAKGYVEMWQTLRNYPSYVLGGLAYAWTIAGPEPGDRNFGLLDNNDVAVDDSFNELTAEFLYDKTLDSADQPVALAQ